MQTVDEKDRPQKKLLPSPRLFFNSPENTLRSIRRLARWTMRHAVTELQLAKVRVTRGLIHENLEYERFIFERERWIREMEIEDRLQEVERQLRERI